MAQDASDFLVKTIVLFLVAMVSLAQAATPGSFRGTVVGRPESGGGEKWLYVQGPKRSIRRVEISSARVSYAPEVKKKDRLANPAYALKEGTQVQVTASQDGSGEWKASAVTILEVVGKSVGTRET